MTVTLAALAADVDLELGVLGGDVGQHVGQGDPLAQGGREGAAGHLADLPVAVEHGHAVARDQPVGGDEADQQPLGPGLLAGGQGLAAAEVALAHGHGPAEAGLERVGVGGDVVAVQGVAHLQPQGVAPAQPDRRDLERRPPLEQLLPQRRGDLARDQQLEPALAGVAGAAHPGRGAPVGGGGQVHVGQVGGLREQAPDELGGARPLDGDDGDVGARGDLGAAGVGGADGVGDLGPVGGVGDQQVAVGLPVHDQVVDDRALVGQAEGVLGGARGGQAVQVVGEGVLEGVVGAVAADLDLAEVGEVEDPDRGAHRPVLGQGALVLDRHVPAGEGAHLGPEAPVDAVQGGAAEVGGGHLGSSRGGRGVRPGGREVRTGGVVWSPSIRSERLALSRAL